MASPLPSAAPARVVVLVSGSGTNLQALLDVIGDDPEGFGARIVAGGGGGAGGGGAARGCPPGRPHCTCRRPPHPT
ncbi:phosphoribosylglycinamide formyltransferase, partial [Streptomyces sp. NPDC002526]